MVPEQGAAPVNLHPPQPMGPDVGAGSLPKRVVYAPTCVTRIMGPSRGDPQQGEGGRGVG